MLIDRATLVAGGVALILLHRAISEVMVLRFHRYEGTLAIFFVNVPHLVIEPWR